MKILLVGEYSNLHNSLKKGFTDIGIEASIIGDGDGFKKFNVDYSIRARFLELPIISKFKNALYTFFKIDLTKLERGIRFFCLLPKLKEFDVVQLINEKPIQTIPRFELFLLKKIIKQNKKTFLLCCGADTFTAKHMIKQQDKYNILTPYFKNKKLKSHFEYVFDYLKPSHQKIHTYLLQHTNGIIASDIDYVEPLINHPNYKGLIPNPINSTLLNSKTLFNYPINILLGINRGNYYAKGINYFEEALIEVKKRIDENKIKIIVSENVPYNNYIKLINDSHIILDQVYSFDQGYNALEAMAKGKIVFTGAETSFLEHYNLKEDNVCINAKPDVKYLTEKLILLIEDIDELKRINKNAQSFIKEHHNHVLIAKKYISVYKN